LSKALFHDLLADLPDLPVQTVLLGTHWTAVVTAIQGHQRCGLASSQRGSDDHHHGAGPAVPEAGTLHLKRSRVLAELVYSASPPEVSVGMAAVNASLPQTEQPWIELNAQSVIAEHGADKRVALVGHFPFVSQLRKHVGHLSVLELRPRGEDLPADAAPEVIPQADVVALTSLTLLNHSFDGLIRLCRPEALVLLLGPTTPLSPVLFDYGVDILSGAITERVPAVLNTVGQGGNFRQVHHAGVRLVTMARESSV
jgi:uncharacterized protein (DUF4213/DUF364 family)